MATTAAISTVPSNLPFPTAHKPNPHPYAVKTTSTALLSRSNSSSHNQQFSRSQYVPLSPSPTKSTSNGNGHGHHRHRYTKSLSDQSHPPSLPIPPLKRAETLPNPSEFIPSNPTEWSNSHLLTYLQSPEARFLTFPVADEVANFVRDSCMTGKAFLRLTDADLEKNVTNPIWRKALLAASCQLRQSLDEGMDDPPLCSSPVQDQDQDLETSPHSPFAGPLYASASSSSSLDLSLPANKAHAHKIGKGHVRSMVASFERDRSPSFSGSEDGDVDAQRQGTTQYITQLDPFQHAADVNLETPPRPIQRKRDRGGGRAPEGEEVEEEPSIEALLSPTTNGPSDDTTPVRRAVGAQAWAEIDSGLHAIATVKRVVSAGSSSADSNAPYVEDVFGYGVDGSNSVEAGGIVDGLHHGGIGLAITENLDKAVQVSSEVSAAYESRPTHRDIGISPDMDLQRLFLEDELRATCVLVDSLRARLEVVEQRVVEIESERMKRESRDMKEESKTSQTPVEHVRQLDGGAVERTSNVFVSTLLAYLCPAPASDTTRDTQLSARTDDTQTHADALVPLRVRGVPAFLLLVGIGVCSFMLNHALRRAGRR